MTLLTAAMPAGLIQSGHRMHSLALSLSLTLSPSLATRYVIQICLLVDGRTLQVSLAAYKGGEESPCWLC